MEMLKQEMQEWRVPTDTGEDQCRLSGNDFNTYMNAQYVYAHGFCPEIFKALLT